MDGAYAEESLVAKNRTITQGNTKRCRSTMLNFRGGQKQTDSVFANMRCRKAVELFLLLAIGVVLGSHLNLESMSVKYIISDYDGPGIIAASGTQTQQDGPNDAATAYAAGGEVKTPFFIGAGHGTTGTRSLFSAMCRLGFSSVHYDGFCIRPNLGKPKKESLRLAVEAHFRVLRLLHRLRKCSWASRATQNSNACPDYSTIASELVKEVTTVVKSDLMFVTDIPYPFLLKHVRKIAREEGLQEIMILTERDPTQWLASRQINHPNTTDIICKEVNHAFDFQKCLQEKNPEFLMYKHAELKGNEKSEKLALHAMTAYYQNVKNEYHPMIYFNLWNEGLKPKHFSTALLSRFGHFLAPATIAQFSSAPALKIEWAEENFDPL